MAKGPVVTPEVEALIAIVYRRHPKWKAKDVHNWVRDALQKNNPNLPDNWPGLSTIQKILATVRKSVNKLPDDPQEKPWSMSSLDEVPISPEVIPAVLKVWKFRVEKGDTFSIREAKWASRLSRLLEDIEELSYKASQYARTELMFQLIGRPFDSTNSDKLLMGLPMPITSDFASFLPFLAEQREDRGIKDGVEQVMQKVTVTKRKGGTL